MLAYLSYHIIIPYLVYGFSCYWAFPNHPEHNYTVGKEDCKIIHLGPQIRKTTCLLIWLSLCIIMLLESVYSQERKDVIKYSIDELLPWMYYVLLIVEIRSWNKQYLLSLVCVLTIQDCDLFEKSSNSISTWYYFDPLYYFYDYYNWFCSYIQIKVLVIIVITILKHEVAISTGK